MRNRVGSLALVLITLLMGCAAPPRTEPSAGAPSVPQAAPVQPSGPKRVVATIQGDPPTLYPALNPAGAARGQEALVDLVNPGLSVVDNRGELEPRLAEAVPALENGLWRVFPDGKMETTWKIRRGAQWHDGAPVTSEDLVFTTRLGQDRDLAVFGGIAYGSIESVEAPDPQTVTIKWRQPFIEADAMFTRRFALPVPRHLLERVYLEDKASLVEQPYWSTEYVGTGPFKVRELVRGSHLLAEMNPSYVLGRPKIDEIEIKYITDPNTVMANLLAGAMDVTLGKTVSLEQAEQIREQWREGKVDVTLANAIQIHPQFLNPNPPVIADLRFRRALYHAIDRQQLVDALSNGTTSIAHGWLPPNEASSRELESRLVKYDYDPRRATQMLEDMGISRGPDGQLRDTGGQRLQVELRTTTDNDAQIKSQLSVADNWQRIGLPSDQHIVPPQRAQEPAYRANFPGFELLRGASDLRSLGAIHSRGARIQENGYRGVGGTNYARYMNPEFDALIERYLATIPQAERLRIGGDILNHMTDQVVVMTLFWDVEPALISNRLVNVTARHKESSSTWNAHVWELR
jgi:peptide/nickel transport system substrate-binding protein